MIRTEDYNYNLPEELIAQTPLKVRSESRLMVLDKENKTYEDKKFSDILDYITENDVLVLNDTKVIPARLYGVKEETNAAIELLLLKDLGENRWQTLARPQRRVKIGSIISFGDGILKAKCVKLLEQGVCEFELIYDGILVEILDKLGEMPLPPYIHEKLLDKSRYQTVYAKNPGSAAAPTAGLHFTQELLKKIEEKGATIVYVTLHVGLGTFRPVDEEDASLHKMHTEYYEVSKEAAEKLNKAKKEGKRIISVGTTSTRTLESNYKEGVGFREACEDTSIFIYPGYKFKAIDALITNFHLPKSTLIMLVSALAGREFILEAYNHAVEEKYRFFSFGDAMFIK
jgi:S-adenosylmethionine:tRNA ribosyltransferase-isomerase